MFNKRRRAASNPAPKTPPSASASLAATKAFVRDRESNASLSSAAAAAALRTHPAPPIQVGDTVTKRMVRKGSVSSQGSGSQQAPGLRRHSSSGSMTERSFRAPSPSRNSPIDHTAPPVPAVPKDVAGASGVHRRASSLEPPYRGGSPAGRGGGRGVSLDRGVANTVAIPGRGQRVSSLSKVPENELDGSPRSINFSRPMSPLQTPTTSRPLSAAQGGQTGWFGGPVVNHEQTFRGAKPRPKASDGPSGFELHSAQRVVQSAAERPVSTHKSQISHGVEGARLATGSMRAKPSGSAVQSKPAPAARSVHPERPRTVDPNSPYAIYDPSTRTFIHKQDAMALHRALSEEDEPAPPYEEPRVTPPRHHEAPQKKPEQWHSQPPQVVQRSHSPPRPLQTHPQEEVDADVLPETRAQTSTTSQPSDATLARKSSEEFADSDIRPIDANTSRKLETTAPERDDVEQETLQSPKLASNQDSPYPTIKSAKSPASGNVQREGSVHSERTHSLSPPRNAHFAAVAMDLANGMRHQPPGRSVSPAKSALKASPSVSRRSNSPLASNGRVLSRGTPSEGSDAMSEDGSKKKKKRTVRVSFDEDPVVAGTSAYPETETPTSPTGLSASKWSSTKEEEALDDFMKPRPVLPSFGSIRDKNRRSREGDDAEKVTETVSSSLSNSATLVSEPLETSNDHVVGGILAQDFAAKKEAQFSPQDPLPPEVTSVEGTGYVSESESSEDSYIAPMEPTIEEEQEIPEPARTPEPEPKTLTTPAESRPIAPEVPAIAIQPASPSPIEKPEPKYQRPFVPGGWDDEDISEPEPEPEPEQKPTQTETTPPAAPATTIAELVAQGHDDESTDDNSSIYSDAYEELSETEDGGFGSIDAVVESPIVKPSGLQSSKYADISKAEPPPKSELRNEYINQTKDEEVTNSDSWNAAQQHRSEMNGPRKQEESLDRAAEKPPVIEPVSISKDTTPVTQAAPGQQRKASVEITTPTPPAPKPTKSSQTAQPRKSAMKKPATAPQTASKPEATQRKTGRDLPASTSIPSSEPRLKKSLRGGPVAAPAPTTEPQLRKTMRSADSGNAARASSGLAASRHSMPPLETKPPRGALQKKHIPAAAAANSASRARPQSSSAASTKPRPQSASAASIPKPRVSVPTYDSDSDASASSFQRQRPRASRKDAGRYTMRSSMRSGPAPTLRTDSTPTVRPMSPPQTKSPPPGLRKSMRPTSPTVERPTSPGLKSSKFSIRSLSPGGRFRPKSSMESPPPLPLQSSKRTSSMIPSFGKPSKSKAPAAAAPKSRFKSRFADSSDEEDDDRPRRFQSRFADSDDDEDFELPPGLTPVRGIPKRPGEEDGDSTDLDDEASDNEVSTPSAAKDIEKGQPPAVNGVSNGQSASFAAGSLRKSKHSTELPQIEAGKKAKTKRGFFGLGKKKTPASYLAEAEAEGASDAATDIPMPPEHRDRDRNRPLTPIGEDKDIEASQSRPRSPKLQRRSAPQWGRSASDSWPLPQPPKIGEEQRPQSSDGIVNQRSSLRPTLTKRTSSQISEARTAIDPKSGKEVVIGRTGKKKKFQGLRRVFGLNN